jgi:hypothetical protein
MESYSNPQTPVEKKTEKILPSDVRYALKYAQGLIRPADIETLNHSHFVPEATYMLTKGLANNPEQHSKYLKQLVTLYKEKAESFKNQVVVLNDEYIKSLPKDQEIDALKLAQISRQGFDLWQEKYKETAEQLAQESKSIFLLANSTIVGLEHFVKAFAEAQKELNIIFPEFIEKKLETIGYSYSFEENQITTSDINRDFHRPENAVILDDTKNTGETFRDIALFWSKEGDHNISFKTIVDKSE